MPRYSILKALLASFALTACQTTAYPPLPSVPQVDLARFIGGWYVMAFVARASYDVGKIQRVLQKWN